MRTGVSVAVLCLVLACGVLVQPWAQAATPVERLPKPLSITEAELLVLVTSPVLRDFSSGGTPVLGEPWLAPTSCDLVVEVRSQTQGLLGTYRVNPRTAQVFNADNGQELHNPQLEVAQRIVRESHGIAVVSPAGLGR